MDRSVEMTEKNVGSLLWSFSLPAIVGMLVNSFYNIVSRIFLGRGVGSIALAAATVAFPIMIILMAVSVLIGIGATALISIRLGEQKKEEAEKIAGNAMAMLIILPAICAIIFLLFTEPILIAFGASEAVLPYAQDYLSIIMFGAAFGSISMGMNNFIRAEGNPTRAMSTQILGAVVNIILHYIFIFQFNWGIKGAALATIIAQFVSALWVLSYFFTGRSLVKIRLKNLRLELSILFPIMAIGFAPFAMQVANSIQNIILNKTLMYYGGDLALSAVGIIMGIATILFMPILGVGQGAQPIIGYNYGAQQYGRVKETWKIAVMGSTCIALAGFVMIRLWAIPIVALFSDGDTELTMLASHALQVYFLLLPVIGFQMISSGYFQAVGKALQSAVLSLSRQVLIFIPLLLILPGFWGIEGVWRTAPIADGLSATLTAIFIYVEMRKISIKQATKQLDGQLEFSTNYRPS